MTIQLSAPYKTRPIRFLGLWEHEGWRVKVYGVSARDERPPQELVDAIKGVAGRTLPQPAVADDRHGIAFLYAHQGANGGGYCSVNWWARENELYHYQYESDASQLAELKSIEETGGSPFCVWDLAVIEHERRAWVESVLANDAGPDLDAYLGRVLEADV